MIGSDAPPAVAGRLRRRSSIKNGHSRGGFRIPVWASTPKPTFFRARAEIGHFPPSPKSAVAGSKQRHLAAGKRRKASAPVRPGVFKCAPPRVRPGAQKRFRLTTEGGLQTGFRA